MQLQKPTTEEIYYGATLGSRVSRGYSQSPESIFKMISTKAGLESFFVSTCNEDLREGADIVWTWGKQIEPLQILKIIPNEQIVFKWGDYVNGHPQSVVWMSIFPDPKDTSKTRLEIIDHGYEANKVGKKTSYDCCEGWTEFLMLLDFRFKKATH